MAHYGIHVFQVHFQKCLKNSPCRCKTSLFTNHVHYYLNANVMDDHPLFWYEMTKTSRKPHVEKDPQFNVSP